MPSLRLAIIAAFIAAFGFHNASALEVEDSNSNSPAANLTDPDSSIPVAHLNDDGSVQQPSGFHLQMQSGDPTAFGFAPGITHSGPVDAFGRAQQNQMQ